MCPWSFLLAAASQPGIGMIINSTVTGCAPAAVFSVLSTSSDRLLYQSYFSWMLISGHSPLWQPHSALVGTLYRHSQFWYCSYRWARRVRTAILCSISSFGKQCSHSDFPSPFLPPSFPPFLLPFLPYASPSLLPFLLPPSITPALLFFYPSVSLSSFHLFPFFPSFPKVLLCGSG